MVRNIVSYYTGTLFWASPRGSSHWVAAATTIVSEIGDRSPLFPDVPRRVSYLPCLWAPPYVDAVHEACASETSPPNSPITLRAERFPVCGLQKTSPPKSPSVSTRRGFSVELWKRRSGANPNSSDGGEVSHPEITIYYYILQAPRRRRKPLRRW